MPDTPSSSTPPIRLTVNGTERTTSAADVHALLAELELTGRRLAVELNRHVLPRSAFDRALEDGDTLEIVTFVGGG